MKSINFFLVLLLIAISSFAQKITIGPDVGEIYFLGPSYSSEGLYYSTDFGETVIYMDSTNTSQAMAITADKTTGVIYYVTMAENLYRSYDFGQQNSWQLINNNIYLDIKSGVLEGQIYNAIVSHSDNYGLDFIPHSYNGFFGSLISSEIDYEQDIGYAIVNTSVPDTLYLLITYDNFENLVLINTFNFMNGEFIYISRGDNIGKIYLYNKIRRHILYSDDYGITFTLMNIFNFSNLYDNSMVGGRQEGEIYVILNFVNMLWQNAHIYIFHSTDYGKTFVVFHPFSKGNEPVLANFSTDTTEGEMPFTVDFCNFSIGDIQEYEWDFDNDGIVDSYEQYPVNTYQDTGYFSVKLTVFGADSSNSFIKENYIHVQKTTDFEEYTGTVTNCYPNPFSNCIHFDFLPYPKQSLITIYDITGKQITTLYKPIGINKILWDGKDKSGNKIKPGVYYAKLDNNTFFQKLMLTD